MEPFIQAEWTENTFLFIVKFRSVSLFLVKFRSFQCHVMVAMDIRMFCEVEVEYVSQVMNAYIQLELFGGKN